MNRRLPAPPPPSCRRPRLSRRLWPALLCGVLLFAPACKPRPGASSSAGTAAPDVLIFARGSDAQKLDPADVSDGESVNTLVQICEGLLRFKSGTLELEPCLAALPTVSPDGLTYTFQLREGVTFHDGTPLNAETAAWSFRRQMDPAHPGHVPGAQFEYWLALYQDIVAVRTPGPMTLEFQLRQPNAALLTSFAIFPTALVSPQALATHGENFQRHPVGTGPYRFVRWTPKQTITLEANPDYWDRANPPRFQRLVLKVVAENAVRVLELKSGAIHALDGVPATEVRALATDDRFTVHRETGLNVAYLTFNLNHARYQDPEVRLAFALAIDRAQLAKIALQDIGRPADYPLPPGFLGYPATPDPIPHDPARAREILARHAPAFAAPVRVQVMTDPRQYLPNPEEAASFIRAELEAVGLKVEVQLRNFQSHLHDLRNFDYDVAIIGWVGDNGDTDNFLSVFFGSWATKPGAATNFANYRSDAMDRLLLDARRETQREARARLYESALAVWRRDVPIIPLVHGDNIVVTRRELTNFRIQKIGDLRLGPVGWDATGTQP